MVVCEQALSQRRGAVSKELIFWGAMVAGVVGVMIYARTIERGGGLQDSQGANHASVGRALSVVSLKLLSGEGKNLEAADLKNHIAMINFWGTWCPPCIKEFPHIVALDQEFRDNANFKLVSISVRAPRGKTTLEELRTNTEQFLNVRGADFPTYHDPDQKTWRGVVEALDGESGVPTTLILGRDGKIRGVWTGYAPGVEREMHALLSKLLADS